MFNILKNLFGGGKNEALINAIKEGAFLVDVRTPAEFKSGSVKGAVNVPLDSIKNQLNQFKNKKNIVVFCRSGMRSSQAKSILEQNGFSNVINGGTWQSVANAITA
ncbi:MAG: rhodanese-like domain-containing protein [Thermonemataceae bacterium]|nr:rhodanese-like domain-containing protein [Thermonemataceae bacterium]